MRHATEAPALGRGRPADVPTTDELAAIVAALFHSEVSDDARPSTQGDRWRYAGRLHDDRTALEIGVTRR